MAYFLKDERRQALIEELVGYRISRDKAERITLISEDEADRHWYAQASICNDTIGDVGRLLLFVELLCRRRPQCRSP